jgi:tetratricopeptide (TPR) repeat protein
VLAGVEPDNVDLIYAQAEIYESLGRLYTIRGQWSEAKLILENAIEKSRDLVRLHSRRSQYRELLARSYNKLAYLYSTSGRPEDAEPFFDKAISECRLLVGEHSRVPDYRNELARNYWQLAEVRYYLGTNKGEVDFREAFAILDKLVQDYPRKVQYALNLAEATHRYATVALRESGDIEASLPLYDQTIARLRNLLTETPQTHVRSQLGAVYVDRAGTLRRLGREEDARKDFEQMAELGKGQSNVDVRLWRAQGLAHLGDYSAAVGELDDMRAKGQEPVFSHYNFACVYSLCSGMVEKDESLPATDRKELAGAYADRAVNMLRELRDLGFFSAFFINYVKNDKDFAPLESHEGFMAFLGELAQEAEDEKEVNE